MSSTTSDAKALPFVLARVGAKGLVSGPSMASSHADEGPVDVIQWVVSDETGQPVTYMTELPGLPYPKDWLHALNRCIPSSCPGMPDHAIHLGMRTLHGRSLMHPTCLADGREKAGLNALLPGVQWQQSPDGKLYLTEAHDIRDGDQLVASLMRWTELNPKALLQERESLLALQELNKQALWRIGHNVRTPLNAVFGLVQMAMLGLSPKGAALVEWQYTVEQALRQFEATVRDAVQMPSWPAGPHLSTGALVSDALQVAQRMLRPAMEAKSIHCVVSTDAGSVAMPGETLVEILLNVLSNAIKYSPHGVAIWIDVLESGPLLKIDVLNAVDAEREIHLPDLNQSARSVALSSSGDGVGLATSQFLARRMGGEIQFAKVGSHQCRASIQVPAA
jgi:Histidine kinase-, DNA gyrase B-, and HSP90-like ATPase